MANSMMDGNSTARVRSLAGSRSRPPSCRPTRSCGPHWHPSPSASLQFMGNRQVSNFVGQWAPTFLILGLYNKMVKQLGSDRTENAI